MIIIYVIYYKILTSGGGDKLKKEILIEGMSCGHCTSHVKETLSGLDGVAHVEVILDDKRAIIEVAVTVEDETIIAAIDDAGYEVVSIKEL